MILNTGQRTDIPAFYSAWFMNRVKEGFVLVRNPFHPQAVTRYEIRPDLVVGESLGAIQAMRVHGMPHLYVSPSLGAPSRIGLLSALSLIPGLTALFNRIWKPREGDRQVLDFRHEILRKYPLHGRKALANAPSCRKDADPAYAFFGAHDHYRRNGVVSIRKWCKFFGPGSYTVYDGTHFMEEEYVLSLLIPKIRAMYSENSRK